MDPITIALVGVAAAIEQERNWFPAYGQGAQGFAKRFGATYADVVAGTFLGSAVMLALLKQDPRVTADFSLRATSFLPENYGHRRGRKGPTVTPIWEPSDSGIESF